MKKWRSLILVFLILQISHVAIARPPNEAEFKAASSLTGQMAAWVNSLSMNEKRVAVFSVIANEPFDPDYGGLIEANFLQHLHKMGFDKASTCSECRSPQINIEGEQLVIRKGTPDPETVKKLGARQGVEAFVTIDIYRTNLFVTAQVSVYRNPSGELIGTERFSEPAVSVQDRDVMLLLTAGTGKTTGNGDAGQKLSFNITLAEELGFAKGGLGLGVVLASQTLIYVTPTLVFSGRFGASGLGYGLSLGGGGGLCNGGTGLAARGSLELYIGTWTVLGAQYIYYAPSGTTTSLSGYYGLHLGVSFGR